MSRLCGSMEVEYLFHQNMVNDYGSTRNCPVLFLHMMCKKAIYTLLGLFLALLPVARLALAAEVATPAEVRLLAAVMAHDSAPVRAGLAMHLAPGWKTYWRNPGDSGIAPKFDWSGSKNVSAVKMHWPAPTRFNLAGETIYGYENAVVLPLLLHVVDPAKKLHLELKLDYAVCSTLCVPLSAKLEMDIPAGVPKPSGDAPLLQYYLSRVPISPRNPEGIGLAFERKPQPRLLISCTECVENTTSPALIVDGPAGAWFGTPKARRKDEAMLYEVPVELEPGISLSGKKVRLIFAGPRTAIEVERYLP